MSNKYLALILLLTSCLALQAQTSTVTGTLTNASGGGVGANAYLAFTLYGCGGNRPVWSGGVITQPFQFYTDASGVITAAANGGTTPAVVRNDQITCGSNTATLAVPSHPVLSTSTAGGSLAAATSIFVKITFTGVISGETTPSGEASITTGAGALNSVTVTAPTLPAGASGYTVYSSTTTGTEKKQTAVGNCANITGNCVIQVIGAGADVPVNNTSVAPPTTYFVQSFVNGTPGPRVQFQINSGTFNWNTATPLTILPVASAPTGDATYCRLDAGNCGFSGTPTLPSGTNVVGRSTTDTLSNKTLNGASSSNSVDLICALNNLTPVVGNGADKVFFSCTIPAGTVGTGKTLEFFVTWAHSTGTAAITYHLNLGGVLISNYGSQADVASSTYAGAGNFINLGTTVAKNDNQFVKQDGGTGAITFIGSSIGYNTGIAVNLTSSQALTMSFNVAATDSVTPQMFIVRVHQ